MRHLGLIVAALLLLSKPSFSQGTDEGKAKARVQFREALAHAQRGDFAEALRAFEAAYATRPHYSVLYNIAQAQAALGRNVEAIATFERYLSEAGRQISDARREEVRATVEVKRRRIGHLEITADAPEDTRIWLDGVELEPGQLGKLIALNAGKHSLLHSTSAGPPVTAPVTVNGAETTTIRIAAPVQPRLHPGELAITCQVPGVTVLLDGVEVATTPLPRPLPVQSGTHRIAFVRPGYLPAERVVTIAADATSITDCHAAIRKPLPPAVSAILRIQTTPKNAQVFLDGRPFGGGAVAFGPHDIKVHHDGYLPYRETISVMPGKARHYEVTLQATATKRLNDRAAAQRRRNLSYLLGGTGLTLLLTSGGVLLWNQGRYDDWREGRPSDMNRVASIQRVDDLSLGLALLGTGLAAAGAWTLLSNGTNE